QAIKPVVTKFAPTPIKIAPGIHPSAVIHPRAKLGDHISIQPLVVIEAGARIGSRTVIGAGSYIGHDVVIGDSCMVYPRVTIRELCRLGARGITPTSERTAA